MRADTEVVASSSSRVVVRVFVPHDHLRRTWMRQSRTGDTAAPVPLDVYGTRRARGDGRGADVVAWRATERPRRRRRDRGAHGAQEEGGRVKKLVRVMEIVVGDDHDDARRGATLDALPIDASFIALVNHAFTLSERDAATFVDAFCASERLTAAFCEDAFDAVYAAYARRAPEDELTTLLELAKIFTTQYKMRAMPLETRVLDETLDAGRRCAAGDVDEAEARARIRDILERAFAIEGLKQRDYIIALREYRVKLERDSRSGKSYALEFLEADETLVAELCDPDSELRASEACRRELIVATDVIFRALDGFLEVAAR